jgi:GTP-binding protein Era
VVNKIDKLHDKARLLPFIEQLSQKYAFHAIIPVSAKTGDHVLHLQSCLRELLPFGPHFFGEDQITDRSSKFLCAELVREKIFRTCGEELPYQTTVEIESFVEEENLFRIHALIWVDKESHKRMIIGDKGSKLKAMATSARLDMERLLAKPVFLRCWCKVKSGWSNDERILKQLGYDG